VASQDSPLAQPAVASQASPSWLGWTQLPARHNRPVQHGLDALHRALALPHAAPPVEPEVPLVPVDVLDAPVVPVLAPVEPELEDVAVLPPDAALPLPPKPPPPEQAVRAMASTDAARTLDMGVPSDMERACIWKARGL